MAEQESMTRKSARTQEHEPSAAPPAGPAHGAAFDPERGVAGQPDPELAGPAGPGTPRGPGGRAARWFGGLSRGRKLALTWSASVLAVVVALLAIGATSGGKASHAPPPRAQAFTLARLGHPGQHISLAQYAGHPLILNFFASWCEPCQRETPLIARFHRSHRAASSSSASTSTTAPQRAWPSPARWAWPTRSRPTRPR